MRLIRHSNAIILRGSNFQLTVGMILCWHAYGFELDWGLRELLEGQPPPEFEVIYADRVQWMACTVRDARRHGSIWRATAARLLWKFWRFAGYPYT